MAFDSIIDDSNEDTNDDYLRKAPIGWQSNETVEKLKAKARAFWQSPQGRTAIRNSYVSENGNQIIPLQLKDVIEFESEQSMQPIDYIDAILKAYEQRTGKIKKRSEITQVMHELKQNYGFK